MVTMLLAIVIAIVGIVLGVALQPHPLLDSGDSTLSTLGFSMGIVGIFAAYSLWRS